VDDAAVLEVLTAAAEAVHRAADALDDWGLAGTRPGQYKIDLAADRRHSRSSTAPVWRWSPRSRPNRGGGELVVVLDPIDGSTNAAHGIPWYATSLCALDDDGARVALVVNQATGERFERSAAVGRAAMVCRSRRRAARIFPMPSSASPAFHVSTRAGPSFGPSCSGTRALRRGTRLARRLRCNRGKLASWLGLSRRDARLYRGGSRCRELHGESLIVRDTTRRAPIAAATDSLFLALSAGLGSDAEPKA